MNKCSSLQQNNSERSGGTSQSCKSRKTGDTGLDFQAYSKAVAQNFSAKNVVSRIS